MKKNSDFTFKNDSTEALLQQRAEVRSQPAGEKYRSQVQARQNQLFSPAHSREEVSEVTAFDRIGYDNLLSVLPVAVYTCNSDGLITYYNDQAVRIWGRAPQKGDTTVRFCGAIRLYLPDGTPVPHSQAPIACVINEGINIRAQEVIVERPDGSQVFVSVNIDPIRDHTGAIIGAVNVMTDITEQKRTEQAMREADALANDRYAELEQIYRYAPVGLFTCDCDYIYTRINERMAEINGFPVEHHIGRRMDEIVPDLMDHLREVGRVVLERGKPVLDVELQGQTPKYPGIERDWLASYFPLRSASGKVVGLIGAVLEVTDRKRAERALQESESRMRTLAAVVESSNDFIGLATPDVKPFYINEAGRRMVGLESPEAVLRTKFKDYFWPEDIDRVKKEAIPSFLSEGSWIGELRFRNFKTGEPIDTRWSAFAIRDDDGEVVAWATISTDLTRMKKAEVALRQSEAQFRQLADAMPQLVWITRPDGHHEYFNRRWYTFTDTTLEESMGDLWSNLLHPDDYKRTMERWHHSLRTGEPYKITYRFKRAGDGAYRWFLGQALPVFDENGEVVRWFGTCTEIHDLIETEEELRQTRDKLQTVLDTAPAGILVADNAGKIMMQSAFTERILGGAVTGDAHGPTTGYQVFTGKGEPLARGDLPLSLALEGKPVADTEILIKRPDGEEAVILASATPLQSDSGENWGAVAVFQDISERKQAEDQLRITLESIGDGFVAYDGNWRFTYINPVSKRLLGISREVLGKNLWDVFPMTRGTVMEKEFRRAAAGEIRDFEYFYEPWGRWFQNRCFPREGGGISVYLRDITEHKKTEEQLRHAQKMEAIGRLAGGVAHEFNNMLNVIIGYADIIDSRLDDGNPLTPYIREIQAAARRSAEMTNQLLAYSRKQMVQPKVIDLNKVIENQQLMLQRLIRENIHIRFDAGNDLWPIRIDPSQMDQILANLAVNARDAITSTGEVAIATENVRIKPADALPDLPSGDYVRLTFADTGVGMEEKVLERVFDPYFTTKEVGKGTGLGLATVYGIVKQNSGSIFADSEPGRGATFTIYLPRSRAEAEDQQIAEEAPVANGTETVLVVEDELQVLNIAEIILQDVGYQVLKANSPAEAICIARQSRKIDLLLTDVIMPEMNGRALQALIEEIHPDIRTLLMSGYAKEDIDRQALRGRSSDLIQKPFTVQSLTEKVREVLDRA